MPNKEYALTMARYNLWQNENLLTAINRLSPTERMKDRGSFFGSIQATVSHIFWGDMTWMSRFAGTQAQTVGIPESTKLISDWEQFCGERKAFDEQILQWAHGISPDWFEGDLSWYSGAAGRDLTLPKKTVIIQLFNHQTHHRGQIHAMLTSAGVKTEDTDLPFMPQRFFEM